MWFERKKEEKAEKPEEKRGWFDRLFQREKEVFEETEEGKLAEEAKKAEEARLAEEAKKAEEARLAEEAQKAEEARLAEEAKKAEEARLAEEAKKAEEARLAEEAKKAEEARLAEEAQKAEEARLAEEAKKAEEARAAEEAKKAEEARLAEEAQKAEEARLAEEAQKAEEARLAEEAKKAEEARLAEEAKKAEEARLAEEAKKAEEARLAEEAQKAKEARLAEEAKKAEEARAAEEAKRAEEARLAEEAKKAEEARLAEEAQKAKEARLAEEAKKAEEPKGFWGKTWEVLNRPVFTIDESWLGNLQERLTKTREEFVQKVKRVALGHTRIDEDLLEELEEILLESDVGVSVSEEVINHLRKKAKAGELSPEDIPEEMGNFLEGYLGAGAPIHLEKGKFNVVMVVGVNGTGKTTTIGKLANRFQAEGFKPLIAAGDTFRAAAIDQLEVWGKRADVPVIRHKEGGDSAAVVFDSIRAGKARGADVLLIDTAGRLHNKANLMSELEKIGRIVDREAPEANREILLVLDATTGQNGLRQAEVFKEIVKLTGVILTKLDGTAKGGVIFGIARDLGIPVKAIGLGEKLDDLKDFNPKLFVKALFGSEKDGE